MWFINYILFAAGLILLACEVEPKRRHHHEKSLSKKIEDGFGEGQRFMKEQVNSPHRNRGWKHGKKKSDSRRHKKDSSSRSSSSSDENEHHGRHGSEYEKRFKDFIKSHKCEGSPVYNKFLQYYKTATANLQKKEGGKKYETSWLQELANNSSTCSNSCPSNVADASSKKKDKKKKTKKKVVEVTEEATQAVEQTIISATTESQ